MFLDIYVADQGVWNKPLLVIVLLVFILYITSLRKAEEDVQLQQVFLFVIGLATLYIIVGTPLASLGHLSFSFHMVQMSIQYFIVPPLLLLGIPESVYQQIVNMSFLRVMRKRFLTPLLALSLFATLFFLYHVPAVLSFLTAHLLLLDGYTFVLFVLSFFMWRPLTAPEEISHSSSWKNRFIWLSGGLLLPACLFFIVSALFESAAVPFMTPTLENLCLPPGASLFSLFDAKTDKVLAGVFMLSIHKIGMVMTCGLHKGLD